MATALEELRVLQVSEVAADEIWKLVVIWDSFARDTVGSQLARAADSIGANIAEAFGRFHYGEKIQFLYYARGSLFEAKYWLNRARTRNLISVEVSQELAERLSDVARQLNVFVKSLKDQRNAESLGSKPSRLRESSERYALKLDDQFDELFSEAEFAWLISNL